MHDQRDDDMKWVRQKESFREEYWTQKCTLIAFVLIYASMNEMASWFVGHRILS